MINVGSVLIHFPGYVCLIPPSLPDAPSISYIARERMLQIVGEVSPFRCPRLQYRLSYHGQTHLANKGAVVCRLVARRAFPTEA